MKLPSLSRSGSCVGFSEDVPRDVEYGVASQYETGHSLLFAGINGLRPCQHLDNVGCLERRIFAGRSDEGLLVDGVIESLWS